MIPLHLVATALLLVVSAAACPSSPSANECTWNDDCLTDAGWAVPCGSCAATTADGGCYVAHADLPRARLHHLLRARPGALTT